VATDLEAGGGARIQRRALRFGREVYMDILAAKSPEPTAVGAVSSAVAVHVASRRWLSYVRRLRMCHDN
jgi:hypothetical protein